MVPPNILFHTPNPKSKVASLEDRWATAKLMLVQFQKYKLRVPTEVEPWPKGRAERVSVNSFGIGGVNAHVS